FGGKFGRVCYWDFTYADLDSQNIFKNKYGNELESYGLDNICNYFLHYGKDDVTPREMFESFNESIKLRKVSEMIVTNNCKIERSVYEDFKRRYLSILERNKTIATYCMRDSILVYKLLEFLNILEEMIEISIINNVDIVRIFSLGEQIRTINAIYRTFIN